MTDISPINTGRLSRPDRTRGPDARPAQQVSEDTRAHTGRAPDRVELSSRARFLNQLKNEAPERTDLIARVREEIENGTYETPEKLDAAVDAIKEDLELENELL